MDWVLLTLVLSSLLSHISSPSLPLSLRTAAIAEGYLSSNSTAGCANLLPEVDGDISLVASWADDWARDHYPWSGQLHYINTPDWKCTYEQSRDCFGGTDGAPMACVDGAIQVRGPFTRTAPLLSVRRRWLTFLLPLLMFPLLSELYCHPGEQ